MSKLICINKYLVVVAIVVFVAISAIYASKIISETKTTLNSRASNNTSDVAIVGGNDTKKGEWPFMVRIYKYHGDSTTPSTNCAGTLIAEGWVLTSGHCVYGPDHKSFKDVTSIVIKAESNRLENAKEFSLFDEEDFEKSIFVHSAYKVITNPIVNIFTGTDSYFARNDIALIRLNSSPKADTVSLLQKSDTRIEYEGAPFAILGWGSRTTLDAPGYTLLQEAVIPRLSTQRDTRNITTNDSSEFIAGFPSGEVNACRGDSGGPAVVWNGDKWLQIGITAYGVGECGTQGSYVGFMYLPFYYDWIKSTLSQNGLRFYNGSGSFSGNNLSNSELKTYLARICGQENWGTIRLDFCGKNKELSVWKAEFEKDTTNKIANFSPVGTIKRDTSITANVNFTKNDGDVVYLEPNTSYYVCIKNNEYQTEDDAEIFRYAREQMIDSFNPKPTSTTKLKPSNETTDFLLEGKNTVEDIKSVFDGYDAKQYGIGCKKISFTYMRKDGYPILLGGTYFNYSKRPLSITTVDKVPKQTHYSNWEVKPLEIQLYTNE